MKALSLFSGIGGIDLACEWAGIDTVAFCEREPFCQKVLRKHWPEVPIYDDVCTLTRERLEADGVGTIDLIHGGYPCQPFSLAGKREGTEDDRHLWPEVFRLIQALNPRWFVGENVAGHITLGLDIVLSDLDSIGYAAEAFVIPAVAVDARHRRDRVFVVAYAKRCASIERCEPDVFRRWKNEAEQAWMGSLGKDVAHSDRARREEQHITAQPTRQGQHTRGVTATRTYANSQPRLQTGSTSSTIGGKWDAWNDASWRSRGHATGTDWWATEPAVGRVANGIPNRVDRLRALGNAVVPQQIYPILAAIKQIDDMLRGEAGIDSTAQPSPKGAAAE